MNTLPTLQQRSRGQAIGAGFPVEGAWSRFEGRRTAEPASSSTTLASRKTVATRMDVGVERILYENAVGTQISGGISAHLGRGSARITSVFGNGGIDVRSRGLGASLTYHDAAGFYTDLQGQLIWFDADLSSDILGPLVHENRGHGHAVSVEAGKRVSLGGNVSLIPQVQLTHSITRFEHFAGPAGTSVSPENGESLDLRVGLGVDHEKTWTDERGRKTTSRVYAVANVNRELRDPATVKVGDVVLQSLDKSLSAGLGVGGEMSWDDDMFALRGEVSVNTPFSGGGHSVTGRAALKIRF
jgi:fibronectin-binding autotransporter adhesin